jgi:predicted helicase
LGSRSRTIQGRNTQTRPGRHRLIEREKTSNKTFQQRFTTFAELCRQSINPDLRDEAVEEMLVQHLLTERIFRRIFKNDEFVHRNVIAAEIEKVIRSLTSRHFSRDAFLAELDPFYAAIEKAADSTTTYAEKQHFLNHVYERFFQGFSKKQADTHGIVYTPQPIVDFMVRSVEEVLKAEFGRSLADQGVHILDPFTGTGNFITRIMQEIPATKLQKKYDNELHCNEVMLLPYYIASMNIEHAYHDKVGEYKPFEGICLVDTFELAEPKQSGFEFMTEGNTDRIQRQKKAPIFVVIGNPPYNMGQVNENDQNKNRKYMHMDKRVQETYTKASKATLRNKLSDPYVKAFRWATDRIRTGGGVVAFVSNNSFLDKIAFDGMRSYLASEFSKIIHLDLKGDAHTSAERRRREGGNIFENQIRVGVGITILIKHPDLQDNRIQVHSVQDYLTSKEKTALLIEFGSASKVPFTVVHADENNNWLTEGHQDDFASFLPLGDRKRKAKAFSETIFSSFSLGIATNRDAWAYSYREASVEKNMRKTISTYTLAARDNDDLVGSTGEHEIKWTDRLLGAHRSGTRLEFDRSKIRPALYRPFSRQYLYFDGLMNQRQYQQHRFFPTNTSENVCFCINDIGYRSPLAILVTDCVPDLHVLAGSDGFQCFPFYRYNEDGTNRRENITDWALDEFSNHYSDPSITKWDIFHYIYTLLHHPNYRTRYAANLKRELPRIPYAPDFRRYAALGKELMDLHIHYEQQPEFPLERIETGKLNWRVEKMKLAKDQSELRYNSFLTLRGIPSEASEYRLGNRSALEWIVDQYQVSTDKRSGNVNDPNRDEDPEYIVRLIGQVIYVSIETVKRVRELDTVALLPPEVTA